MKLGIVGAGNVGCACAFSAVKRGSARKIGPVNRTRKMAEAVATDIRYGSVLCPPVTIADGDYDALKGNALVMITSGVNGGASERSDPQGRLRLLGKNAEIYRDIVPKIVRAAPDTVLLPSVVGARAFPQCRCPNCRTTDAKAGRRPRRI
jgi:L-lactate dehydrogenase